MNAAEARKLISEIVSKFPDNIRYSGHALKQFTTRDLTAVDVVNVLFSASSTLEEGELEKGTYRYRLSTRKIIVVVAFACADTLEVVSAWRKDKV